MRSTKSNVNRNQIQFVQKLDNAFKIALKSQLAITNDKAFMLSLQIDEVVLKRRKIANAISGEDMISQKSQP